jgi:hypothetical protein
MGRSKAVLFAPAKSKTVPFPREVSRRLGSVNKSVDSLNKATQDRHTTNAHYSKSLGLFATRFLSSTSPGSVGANGRSSLSRLKNLSELFCSDFVSTAGTIKGDRVGAGWPRNDLLQSGCGHYDWLIAHIDADERVKRIGVYALDGGIGGSINL